MSTPTRREPVSAMQLIRAAADATAGRNRVPEEVLKRVRSYYTDVRKPTPSARVVQAHLNPQRPELFRRHVGKDEGFRTFLDLHCTETGAAAWVHHNFGHVFEQLNDFTWENYTEDGDVLHYPGLDERVRREWIQTEVYWCFRYNDEPGKYVMRLKVKDHNRSGRIIFIGMAFSPTSLDARYEQFACDLMDDMEELTREELCPEILRPEELAMLE
jgi:hypothetical protein